MKCGAGASTSTSMRVTGVQSDRLDPQPLLTRLKRADLITYRQG